MKLVFQVNQHRCLDGSSEVLLPLLKWMWIISPFITR